MCINIKEFNYCTDRSKSFNFSYEHATRHISETKTSFNGMVIYGIQTYLKNN